MPGRSRSQRTWINPGCSDPVETRWREGGHVPETDPESEEGRHPPVGPGGGSSLRKRDMDLD